MPDPAQQTVPSLLVENLSRDLILAVEEALFVGAARGFDAAIGMHEGHLPTVVGQMRHFHMNEAFRDALEVAGASPSPIKGNSVVIGRAGVFSLSRFNISAGLWNNGRRSRTRREMSLANRAVEPLVQPELFGPVASIQKATAFFVASFSGSLSMQPDRPLAIDIAVPNSEMTGWLFREPLALFAERYDAAPQQRDDAMPTLKRGLLDIGRDGVG